MALAHDIADTQAPLPPRNRRRMLTLTLLAIWGPGLIVMLADTDAGCLITAAQSGAQWGYSMVLPQVVLIPILYMAQEITVRLGIVTGKGHGALIREYFGPRWAWLSGSTLFISAIGALLTEFVGVAGVGELFGVSKWITVPVATAFLIGIAMTRSYRRVERIGIAVGLAELAFIPAMILAHPKMHDLLKGLHTVPLGHSSYVFLLAANVGAVIMPWMIFYQQSAVVDKGLKKSAIRAARRDTAVGSVLTQGIMIVVIIAFAATVYASGHGSMSLNTVGQLAGGLAPYIGSTEAKVMVGAAILGGALVAALVVSLAGSWGLAEVIGWKHSLNAPISRQNWKFYFVYAMSHIVGAALVLASFNLVRLAVDVEVMNALMLPLVLGFLLLLEAKALPSEFRMRGAYRFINTGLCLVVIVFGLYMIPQTLGW
ncbi:NRAMP family divalent metal transporter [Rudaeicoccus suwonensis]|uniref:NRAMP (Natural resistance-associated macrophage protein)-like metal ion transporter n=1 Tax=Rudaeicoccus suwonensis TaxID=657409 RepID=A0A561E6X5_9MICO|nr:divalent metal cation transporter [Rudaeicoccus suwonensis]TWE11361.1 NRAMP (natural resistance-associated macrophage protein)-like metal ion transporter [Rudaeicoccus suwonensis]